MLTTTLNPSWIYPQAAFDFDFANGRYFQCNLWQGIGDGSNANVYASTFVEGNSGATGLTAVDSSGIVKAVPQYAMRRGQGLGLWVEGNTTNKCLWCRDFTNAAWVKTTLTAAVNQVGSGGTPNTASSLTATAINGTALQVITAVGATTYSFSAYVRRVTGSGNIFMTMDGITYTNITSLINSNTMVMISVPAQTGATTYSAGFKLATSGDAIAVDMCQFENNSFPTTPMITTSATNTRGAEAAFMNSVSGPIYNDGLRLLQAINNSAASLTVLVQYSGNFTSGHLLYGDDLNGVFIQGTGVGSTVSANNSGFQTVTTSNNEVQGLGNINKVCVRFTGESNGLSICLNGGPIATAAGRFSPVQAITHGGIGNVGSGVAPLNGYFPRVTCWKKALSDGQMINYTQ